MNSNHVEPELSVESAIQWRKSLSFSDIGPTAKELYLYLERLKNCSLNDQTRFDILEILRPSISYICENLFNRYLNSKSILSPEKRKIALLSQKLEEIVCDSYTSVVEGQNKRWFKNKKLMHIALYRAVLYYHKTLYYCYQFYTPPPKQLWSKMHHLYQLAQTNKLLKRKVNHNILVYLKHDTILDIYTHAILISIANPFRLSRQDLFVLNDSVANWTKFVQYQDSKTSEDSLYSIDLNSDFPATYSAFVPKDDGKLILPFNLKHLTDKISEELFELQSELEQLNIKKVPEKIIKKELYNKLLTTWRTMPSRGKERQSVNGQLKVCVGINRIYKHLARQVSDYDEMFTCKIVNTSTAGYCLHWTDPTPPYLQSGELIGLRLNENDPNSWLVGTVRWIKHLSNHQIHIGVQLLAAKAQAVKLHIRKSDKGINALLLQPSHNTNEKNLLAPAISLKEGSSIEVESEDNTMYFVLQALLNSSLSFQQFECIAIPTLNNQETLPQNPQPPT